MFDSLLEYCVEYRSILAFISSFLLLFFTMPIFIKLLIKSNKNGQPIIKYLANVHQRDKNGTPSMGGVLIFICTLFSIITFADLSNKILLLIIFTHSTFFLIGFIDDYFKIYTKKRTGISPKVKFIMQIIFATCFVFLLNKFNGGELNRTLKIPFLFNFTLPYESLYFIFAIFLIIATSNSTNLMDGLDSLVSLPIILNITIFTIIAYYLLPFSNNSNIYNINTKELLVFSAAFIGSSFAFLWYNAPPAKIFMGDSGSLPAGALIAAISIIVKEEILLLITGLVFVIETMSVIIQIAYFKIYKKKLFLITPIHHHFEQQNIAETTITIRFWILAIISFIIALFYIFLQHIKY